MFTMIFNETMNLPWRVKCPRIGREMWQDLQMFKRDIKVGDVFKIPMNYYMSAVSGAEWNSPLVDMTVTEKYPNVVTLVRQARYGKITISPDYAKLLMFEREYGSSRI